MVNCMLMISADLENLTNLQPQGGCDDPNFSYFFKVPSLSLPQYYLRFAALDSSLLRIYFLHCSLCFTKWMNFGMGFSFLFLLLSLLYFKWMRVLIFRFLVLGYSFYLIFKYRWLLWLWSLVMLFTLFCFGFFVLILFLSVQICCLLLCMFVFLCIMIIFSSISVTHHIIFRSDLYMLMDVHISWFSVTLYITLIKLYYMFVLLILVS